jgi:hypothetical protein
MNCTTRFAVFIGAFAPNVAETGNAFVDARERPVQSLFLESVMQSAGEPPKAQAPARSIRY